MNAISNRKPELSGQTANLLLSCLFFIPPALIVLTYRYLRLPYEITAWIQYGWIVGMVVGVVIGWYAGFPRWFYRYALTILGLMIAVTIGSDSDMTWQENLYFKILVLIPTILFLCWSG